MYKRDFLQLDSPLLGWMRDYEAMASVLKSLPALQGLTSEQVDFVIDNFQREELVKDDVVGTPEDYVSRISVVASGSLVCIDSNSYPMVCAFPPFLECPFLWPRVTLFSMSNGKLSSRIVFSGGLHQDPS